MRATWPVGIAAGVLLGLGTLVAIEGATDEAAAQGGFTVTPAQLQINQKISQAAVRRSNRGLNYLAPIRTTQTDNADNGNKGVTPLSRIPGSGKGWTSGQIADGAITTPKLGDGSATEAKLANGSVTEAKLANGSVTEAKLAAALADKLPKWAVVNTDGTLLRGTTGVTSLRINAGNYRVAFGKDISQCSWAGVQVEVTAAQLGNIGIELDVTDNTRLFVRTTDAADATADRVFSVQVAC
jgi:hypothetical protein